MQLELTEEERQLTILALALASLLRPGFDWALRGVAIKLGGEDELDAFKMLNTDRVSPLPAAMPQAAARVAP